MELEALVAVAACAVDFRVQGGALLEGVLCVGYIAWFLEAPDAPTLSGRGSGEPGALELAVPASHAACPQLRAVVVRTQDDTRGCRARQGPDPRLV